MAIFHIKITTGKKFGGSTQANVYIVLYGEQGSSGRQILLIIVYCLFICLFIIQYHNREFETQTVYYKGNESEHT